MKEQKENKIILMAFAKKKKNMQYIPQKKRDSLIILKNEFRKEKKSLGSDKNAFMLFFLNPIVENDLVSFLN